MVSRFRHKRAVYFAGCRRIDFVIFCGFGGTDMETTQVLYTRNFSDLDQLQEAHILQYALTADPQEPNPYGVAVMELWRNDRSAQFCRALFRWKEDAFRLLTFLWENTIDSQTMPEIIEDLRCADLLSCKKEDK